MSLDASLRDAGHALLLALGRSVTLLKVSQSTDTIAGSVTETETKYVVRGGIASSAGRQSNRFSKEHWPESAVGDVTRVLYMSAKDMRRHSVRPALGDRVLVGGTSWQVVALSDYEPGYSAVLYRALVTRLAVADTVDEGDPVLASSSGIVYDQSSAGLSVGSIVVDSSGTWILAQANGTDPDDDSALGTGIVVGVPSATQVTVVSEAAVLTASLGLAEGDTFWLSQGTAGGVTTTKPTSGWRQKLGKVLPGSKTLWFPEPGEFL